MLKSIKKFKVLIIASIVTLSNLNTSAQVTSCNGFTTYTQGGWGTTPKGNNPGTILDANFSKALPTGLTIGSINKITLTSSAAVRAFLPQGSTARKLNAGTLVNPNKNVYSNVLAGQLVAATINVEVDKVLASFGASNTNLKDLLVVVAPFKNLTIAEVIAEANKFVGGSPSSYSATDLNNILTKFNEAYNSGVNTNTFISCPIIYSTTSTNVSCFSGSNGSISVIGINGGAGAPYSVYINNVLASANISNLKAGSYEIKVVDKNGIFSKSTVVISQPSTLLTSNSKATSTILCNGGTADVTVSANGGTPPYKGTGTFTVSAGKYSYTVTDANGCTSTTETEVTEPTLLTSSSNATQILCNGGTADVTVSANGGTAPYSGIGTFTVTAGKYSYTVTDANGCTSTTEIEVTEPTLLTSNSNATQILCNGGTADVTVSADGGTAPYSGTGTFTVSAGKYSYTVTDANGCTSTTEIEVTEPTLLTSSSNATQILCNGGTADVTVSADGGTAPYSGTGTFTVSAGKYSYTVTDANGCTSTTEIEVTEPTLLTSSSNATQILCNGGTADVTVSANGGTTPYSGTGTFTVTAGKYSYTVTDANGCASTTEIEVTEPTLLTSSSNATQILCNGGTADVTVSADGGTAPYSGTGTFTVSAGKYSYTVTDANGCTSTTEIEVTEPTLLTSSSNATQILCNGGTADVTVSANGGTAPYSGTGTFTVSAGKYSYTVTDANGCTSTTEIEVTEPTLLTSSSNATQILCNGGTADVTVSADGGTAPYSGTGTFTVSAGKYSYTVTDANGCTSTTEIEVTEPTALQLSGSTTDDESCNGGTATGTANVTVSGGTAPYTYLWSNAATTSSVSAIAYNTILSVTVTDANGCSAIFNFDTISCEVINPVVCDALKTFTQGGWGVEPRGNNAGVYLHANFSSAFPNGIVIGSGSNKATFTTAAAVTAFLPVNSGTPGSISGTNTNPSNTNFNVFAGQLLAASLNVGFDSYSTSFAAGTNVLADMYCNFTGFYGVKVSDLISEANLKISGGSTSHTFSQLNDALTKLNENYDNGNTDNGDFVCEVEDNDAPVYLNNTINTNFNSFDKSINIYPNPAVNSFNLSFNSNNDQVATVKVFNISGQLLFTETHSLTHGLNTINVTIDNISINSNILYVELNFNNTTARKVLMLNK